MKKTFIALLMSCFVFTAYGQDEKINIGLRGGVNLAKISYTTDANISFGGTSITSKNKSRIGFHLGAYSEFKISEIFSVQPELMFSMKGGAYEEKSTSGSSSSEYKESISLSYIELPVLTRFNVGNFQITGGPYLGFLMGVKSKTTSTSINGSTTVTSETESTDKDGLNGLEVGANLGVGYQLENGLNFGIRWVKGISNLLDTDGSIVSIYRSNSVVQFTVGFDLASF